MNHRRRSLQLACASLLGILGATSLHAQSDFPSRPVTIVVPYGAGGGADFLARTIAPKMGERLGKPVVVENKPGAGSAIAASDVARSAPDGHRLLLGDLSTFSTNTHLYKRLSYDPVHDFAALTLTGRTPYVLVVNPSVHPGRSLSDFLKAARQSPSNTFNYGSAGTGGPAHLATVMLERAAKIDMVHVPYKGTAPALPSLLNGEIGMIFTVYSSAKPFLANDRLRIIGTGAPQPQPELPGVPPIGATLPGFEAWFWLGLAAPKGTPAPILDKLREAYAAAVNDPSTRKKLIDGGVEPLVTTGPQMEAYVRSESERWGKIIKDAQIQLD